MTLGELSDFLRTEDNKKASNKAKNISDYCSRGKKKNKGHMI